MNLRLLINSTCHISSICSERTRHRVTYKRPTPNVYRTMRTNELIPSLPAFVIAEPRLVVKRDAMQGQWVIIMERLLIWNAINTINKTRADELPKWKINYNSNSNNCLCILWNEVTVQYMMFIYVASFYFFQTLPRVCIIVFFFFFVYFVLFAGV